jgi:hypothetical protein
MYREFILMGFAVCTAALPLDKFSDDSMHQASYHPYYSYGPYPSAVEAEAAKMQHGIFLTRHPSPPPPF